MKEKIPTDRPTPHQPETKTSGKRNRHISLCRCCFQPNQIEGLNFKCNIIVTITTVVEAPDKGSNFDFKFEKKKKK